MAEVGQRLSGVCRHTAIKSGRSRRVCGEENPRAQPRFLVFNDDPRRADPVSNLRHSDPGALERWRGGDGRSQPAPPLSNGGVRIRDSLQGAGEPGGTLSSRWWALLGSSEAPVHRETFRASQKLRDFCTLTFALSALGSDQPRLRHLTANRRAPWSCTTSRCYSSDTSLLRRSRTAYYDVLKVSPGATQSQIKTAYYKQTFIYHPDRNPGSKEAVQRFSEVREAYNVLGNVVLRRKYDRGILSQSDVSGAGRPSSRAATSAPYQQPQRGGTRRFSQRGGKTMFDFDAFYQAHYGDQLQRDRAMKARKEQLAEEQKRRYEQWRKDKMLELSVATLVALAGVIILNLRRS